MSKYIYIFQFIYLVWKTFSTNYGKKFVAEKVEQMIMNYNLRLYISLISFGIIPL